MIREIKNEIPNGDTFTLVKEINKGMSGEKKYYIEDKNGKKFLLRITDVSNYQLKKKEYDFVLQLKKWKKYYRVCQKRSNIALDIRLVRY